MMIALTYRCNMGCTHCISDCKPDGIDMSKDTLIDSLDFINKHKIKAILFSGGEPFEHPDIISLLDIIEEKLDKNIPITFATNGRVLADNIEIYEKVSELVKKNKKRIIIQVTDDDRFYPTKLNEKQRYRLEKIGAVIEGVPSYVSDRNKCLYPQGRALDNFDESFYYTIAPKCVNVRLLVRQNINKISNICDTLLMRGKMCTPVIAPNGMLKIGESALCPEVASIYDNETDIIRKISHFNCNKCTYALEQLKRNNLLAYNLLIKE